MMLAETLIRKHLPPEWNWNLETDKQNIRYTTILWKFLDLKDSTYSIQRIAMQGTDLGRHVGEWHGPNTIAHVLRSVRPLNLPLTHILWAVNM